LSGSSLYHLVWYFFGGGLMTFSRLPVLLRRRSRVLPPLRYCEMELLATDTVSSSLHAYVNARSDCVLDSGDDVRPPRLGGALDGRRLASLVDEDDAAPGVGVAGAVGCR